MKKAKLLMAFACLVFFSAVVYTNLICDCKPSTTTISYTKTMEEIKLPNFAPKAVAVNIALHETNKTLVNTAEKKVKKVNSLRPKQAQPIAKFLTAGIDWLASAQLQNGGWGADQYNNQHIKNPNALSVDPATTAFSAMALLRSGNTLQDGVYSNNLLKALELLIKMSEESTETTPNITTITGTQPQRKLGQNIDVAMAAQFFAKILDQTQEYKTLHSRTKKALKKCIDKIEKSQHKDGSWNDQGWAPVLQSAMANNALEVSESVGISVDKDALVRSREYQKQNITPSGDVSTEKAAGIQLYAASSTQRATAEEANEVKETLNKNKTFQNIEESKTPPPAVLTEVTSLLEKEGYDKKLAYDLASSYTINKSAAQQMKNDAVLSGFGNNGGEEFLSYMMASESLVRENNQQEWLNWHQKMSKRLSKVQNSNGSWSGHHCITSPVFCTAAVIMTLTADRE